jgi:hypothetical protein
MADRRPSAPPRGLIMVIIATLLTLGLAVAAIRPAWQVDPISFEFPERSARFRPPPELTIAGTPNATTGTVPPQPAPDLSWIRWVLLGIGIAVVAIILTVIVARLLAVRQLAVSRPDEEIEVLGDVGPDLPTLQQGAARAEERLLAIGNPTDAIIAAWLALEEAADASGVHRQPAQTPTEFTADVLGRTGVDSEPVQTLLGLYLRARFAARPAAPQDLETARRCVRDLADNWQTFAETGSRS